MLKDTVAQGESLAIRDGNAHYAQLILPAKDRSETLRPDKATFGIETQAVGRTLVSIEVEGL